MKLRYYALGVLLLLAAACIAQAPSKTGGLVVHEWGTFLTMSGGDGVTLDAMYHEEHALPGFVHARSKEQLHMPSANAKGETPVIYFYTNRQQDVSVKVRFPQGVWTQWYPQAAMVGPGLEQSAAPLTPRNGHITWYAEVLPSESKDLSSRLPQTASDSLWNYARQVDAAYVRTTNSSAHQEKEEFERFLFYRGLGQAGLPLTFTNIANGTLSLSASEPVTLSHLFVLRVERGKGAYRYFASLSPGSTLTDTIPNMTDAQPLDAFVKDIGDDLADKLTQSGLYAKEARAMVNTWTSSYFKTDGIRVLYVLPQSWTDRFIPMEIDPKPQALVRVMVGRTELLTPERQHKVETAVHGLASADSATREGAFLTLRDQGRYIEPILRYTARTTHDAQTKALCNQLLLTDFVTDLRTTLNNAGDGERREEKPSLIRAQLAVLLREMGKKEEAKTEASAALSALGQAQPDMHESESRHYFRAYARAQEGLGNDREAASGYARFIQFASQVSSGCANSCHSGITAPRNLAWFHDWYVGQRFAATVARSGQTQQVLADQKALLARNPNNVSAQMMLAYLYDAQGDKAHAEAAWARLSGKGKGDIAFTSP
ncbi:MAG TPA: hypothetical protein VKU00_24190 [Chthonomonadaceae bacterium]|nr:hypothetical protein [Chthonomonadaceae bacterium]